MLNENGRYIRKVDPICTSARKNIGTVNKSVHFNNPSY